MKTRPRSNMFWLLIATLSWSGVTLANRSFHEHMAGILTGDGEWRTPNPDYEAGQPRPEHFVIRMRLSDDGSHARGALLGLYDDGRMALYWTLFAMFNPVSKKVVVQQIGWDGSLSRGEVALQPGNRQIVDMIEYGAGGSMKMVRHDTVATPRQVRESKVYERNSEGRWELQREWRWDYVADVESLELPETAIAPSTELQRQMGKLLAGSGQWRAPNPAAAEDASAATHYGMNYRWGAYGKFVDAEIVSVFADGRIVHEWQLLVTLNPITGLTHIEQTGGSGVYFRGEVGVMDNGGHSTEGIVYLPNGTMKSVRDEDTFNDSKTRIARVFERGESGDWTRVRQWTWSLQP